MYLEIVKTDFLSLDGTISSFTLTPQKDSVQSDKIRVDRVVEFERTRVNRDKELGGNIIYNFNDCTISRTDTPPNRNFQIDDINGLFSFEYNHMNIPLGPTNQGIGGRWNLILPKGWRLTELYIADPYHREERVEYKRQFRHSVCWDISNDIQLVEMELRSRRGSFSFIVKGTARKFTNQEEISYISSTDSDFGFKELCDVPSFDIHGRFIRVNKLEKILKCIEAKPGAFGFTIDLKEIVKLFTK
ncbi:hypothetical protein IFT92_26055 [Peribacillus simplex]|uniref:hypothetical protein n=1 Tax=Peribacillus simplex TaxID=1478 RepID=UPI0019243188|nr:hypothetical protein [Peribacillus simplex]MBD8591205.1 hypothetical protein [Peribacillus simplex]